MSVLSFYAFFPSFSPRNGPRASISQSPCSQAHSAELINSEYGKYANPTSYSQSAASPTPRTASAQPAATATPSAATTLWKSDHATICSARYGNFCHCSISVSPFSTSNPLLRVKNTGICKQSNKCIIFTFGKLFVFLVLLRVRLEEP